MAGAILRVVGSGRVYVSDDIENLLRAEAAKQRRVIGPIRNAEDVVRAALMGLTEADIVAVYEATVGSEE